MRIVMIGDIGVVGGMLHVGDEAMIEVLVGELHERGFDVTALSANPAESSARYSVDAIPPIGFVLGREVQEDRMLDVLALASGRDDALAADDPARAVVEAVAGADGVVIAGGGDLSSIRPSHVFERAAVGRLAEAAGIPLVVTGQAVGPHLDQADSALVRRLLSSARIVGLRDEASLAQVEELGVPRILLQQTVDDASFLADRPGPGHPLPTSPYCLVSLARDTGGEDQELFASRTAELLDGLASATGLRIVFSAHFGAIDGSPGRGDTVLHDLVRRRMSGSADSVVVEAARHAAQLAAGAEIVVTSSYHAAVFSAAAAVPALAVAVDHHSTATLTGALGAFGQSGVLPGADLMLGLGPDSIAAVWSDRDRIGRRGEELVPLRRAESIAWWERVAAALETGVRRR